MNPFTYKPALNVAENRGNAELRAFVNRPGDN